MRGGFFFCSLSDIFHAPVSVGIQGTCFQLYIKLTRQTSPLRRYGRCQKSIQAGGLLSCIILKCPTQYHVAMQIVSVPTWKRQAFEGGFNRGYVFLLFSADCSGSTHSHTPKPHFIANSKHPTVDHR